ncbi:XRE family transcriptional regulator [Pseudomonas daroniae]|uniref:XRE family transcriptional regulator n=1 Tax=Phytopseudomonas daroniae TaxID=2487519 RepID=A0A4Q9QQ56_9GAMM|nr:MULTISPECIES: helix-turn-helix transcriptional regulator [Pseudomonas]TBU78629.1 XRE family transcriptional regulator [Pseudomonas daroniae]TBU82705.1 XRE family transcriptional regulator [Pseudomonas daroniae]TBU86094.1 XRE family transcriptional regulator [Pseudomonas sp. FRB 228]TBU95257.1 XRE family transcriptional regulator [Pseudomonas daroniae]
MSIFGKTLRKARLAAGLTQEHLGFEVGVTKASVSAWENGREMPSFNALLSLRAALKISLDTLVDGWPDETLVQERPSAYLSDPRRTWSEREFALLQRFRGMSGRRQEAFLEIMCPGE